jgi:uncharacterized membrane protein YadS
MHDRKDLTEIKSESEQHNVLSFRRKLGKIALVIGGFLIVSLVILGVCVSYVAAYNGSSILTQDYLNIAIPGFVLGFVLMAIGLIALVLPEGFPRDAIWSMQTGPIR